MKFRVCFDLCEANNNRFLPYGRNDIVICFIGGKLTLAKDYQRIDILLRRYDIGFLGKHNKKEKSP